MRLRKTLAYSIQTPGGSFIRMMRSKCRHRQYAPAIVPTDTALIEVPLPRPRPLLRDIIRENPVALISAFRQQHGEGPVAISGVLTRIAQEQANAMAARDLLDHDLLAPFARRGTGSEAITTVERHAAVQYF